MGFSEGFEKNIDFIGKIAIDKAGGLSYNKQVLA